MGCFQVRQVEDDIEVVYCFFIGLSCNFQAAISEKTAQMFFDEFCLPYLSSLYLDCPCSQHGCSDSVLVITPNW